VRDATSKAPSSYSIIAATDVIGLLIENSRTSVSSVNGASDSMSRWPLVDECTNWPRRLTAMCHPANFLSSMYPWKWRSMRERRPGVNPASAGSISIFSCDIGRAWLIRGIVGEPVACGLP
jgi:hypothetical protein